MSRCSVEKNEAIINLRLDPILAKIMRALVDAGGLQGEFYLEKARWLHRNIPSDALRKSLGYSPKPRSARIA